MGKPFQKPPRRSTIFAFTGYGAAWGPYLSMLPDVQRATGADQAQLGAALLVGALAAMPAMFVIGGLLDRFGRPVAVATMVFFAVVAAGPALAGSVPALMVAVALFGLGSGACNVVVVALAASVESGGGRPVMNHAHGMFSVGLLVSSLGTGVARSVGVPGTTVAVAVAATLAAAGLAGRWFLPRVLNRATRGPRRRVRLGAPILLLSLLGALAMIVESGVQQWSAVYLADVTRASVGLSAAAPGIFAGAMATGRLAGNRLAELVSSRTLLVGSGVLSGAGVLVVATARSPLQALLGIALVGGAVSVTTPTVYGLIARRAEPVDSGAVIGSTTSLAGIGLLLGPALVGQLAQLTGLPTAIATLSAVCLAASLLAHRVTTPDRNRSGHPAPLIGGRI